MGHSTRPNSSRVGHLVNQPNQAHLLANLKILKKIELGSAYHGGLNRLTQLNKKNYNFFLQS